MFTLTRQSTHSYTTCTLMEKNFLPPFFIVDRRVRTRKRDDEMIQMYISCKLMRRGCELKKFSFTRFSKTKESLERDILRYSISITWGVGKQIRWWWRGGGSWRRKLFEYKIYRYNTFRPHFVSLLCRAEFHREF